MHRAALLLKCWVAVSFFFFKNEWLCGTIVSKPYKHLPYAQEDVGSNHLLVTHYVVQMRH